MTNVTTTPASLANTADAETEAFQEYLQSADGSHRLSVLQIDLECISDAVADLEGQLADAGEIVGSIDEAMDYAESVINSLREIREGYVDRLGIPDEIKEAAIATRTMQSKPAVACLRYGLELMAGSQRRISAELLRDLVSLGMPRAISGRVIKTYGAAARSVHQGWLADAGKGAL
jgi:hypothetical protein